MMALSNAPIPSTTDELDQLENQFIVSKAVSLVCRDLGCGKGEALAAICRDWMEVRQVEILSPNQLEHSTPVDYKPSLIDQVRKFL